MKGCQLEKGNMEDIGMRLVKAGQEHVRELVKISKDAFDSDIHVGASKTEGPPEYSSFKWHEEMMEQGHLLAALEGKTIVGGAIVFRDTDHNHLIYVGRIFVEPSKFRKGYGMAIMNEIEHMEGISVVELDTPIWNKRTNPFYLKLGYQEIRRDEETVYYRKYC